MFIRELNTALDLAGQAGAIQLEARRSTIPFEKKSDTSPVTAIDKKCEELLRNNLLTAFPDDSFLGEESGLVKGNSGRCWIIDPIDGTRPFIRGIPTYSTLIALEEEEVPVAGVIHLPELKTTCWASSGGGAWLNGRPIHVSTTQHIDEAMGSALGFIEHEDGLLREKLLSFMHHWNYAYGFMDAFSYVCLASGKLDLCVNLLDKPWDCAAAACIVTEAGGSFSDLKGNPTVHNGSFVISNGVLHRSIIEYFNG